MIIDDSSDVLAALGASLESEGIEVVATANGRADGIERVLALQPDCVLVDVDLGEESGTQLAEELSARGVRGAIILISAYREYVALAEGTSVSGFLSKTDISRTAIEQLIASADGGS